MKRENKEFETKVLFDSRDIDYESYSEWAEDIGEEPNPADYYDWYSQEMMCGQDYVDGYFKRELADNKTVYIFGTLGLWDGRHEIIPVKVENWNMALSKMLGKDTEEYKISQISDYEFTLEAFHHDGRNEFHFRFFNDEHGYLNDKVEDLSDLSLFEFIDIDEF